MVTADTHGMATDEAKKPLVRRAAEARDKAVSGVVALGKNLLEAAIGAFRGGTSGGLARVHRIFHDAEAGTFFRRVGREWGELVDQGRIEAKRIADPEVRTTLASITEDLEREVPDQRRLDILRRILLGIAIGSTDDPGETRGLAFLQTARSLTGLQAHILRIAYRTRLQELPKERFRHTHDRGDEWLRAAIVASGVPYREVLLDELNKLASLHLVLGGSQPSVGEPGMTVLTGYGFAFCDFLQRCGPFEDPAQAPSSA